MRTINEYKNRFYNLLEATVGNVKPLINENEDPYSDLYGKTVTYKDSQSGVELKGTITDMVMIEPNYIMIVHNRLYVTDKQSMGYIKKVEPSSNTSNIYYSYYICETKMFSINLVEYKLERDETTGQKKEVYGNVKDIETFTCKGLSDILSQRYPCATDFSMNSNPDIPNNLA